MEIKKFQAIYHKVFVKIHDKRNFTREIKDFSVATVFFFNAKHLVIWQGSSTRQKLLR